MRKYIVLYLSFKDFDNLIEIYEQCWGMSIEGTLPKSASGCVFVWEE